MYINWRLEALFDLYPKEYKSHCIMLGMPDGTMVRCYGFAGSSNIDLARWVNSKTTATTATTASVVTSATSDSSYTIITY